MMESIALNESQMVEPDTEYVIVDADDMEMDDEDDYDYCDDVFPKESPMNSCSFSVDSVESDDIHSALELETLKEETEERGGASTVSLDGSDVTTNDMKIPTDKEMSEPKPTVESLMSTEIRDDNEGERTGKEAKDASSRLSNKKRRKKMKLMKKAAAAAAAAAALAEISRGGTPTRHAKPSKMQSTKPNRSSKKKVSNFAVACATQTLSEFRKEHNVKLAKPQNLVALL